MRHSAFKLEQSLFSELSQTIKCINQIRAVQFLIACIAVLDAHLKMTKKRHFMNSNKFPIEMNGLWDAIANDNIDLTKLCRRT